MGRKRAKVVSRKGPTHSTQGVLHYHSAAQDSAFLKKLSSEIRNKIYELTLINNKDIDITTEKLPGLITVCRQIRQESKDIYYYHNTFFFRTTQKGKDSLNPVIRWLEQIALQSSNFARKIKIQIGKDNGVLFEDPRIEDNAWVSLATALSKCLPSKDITVEIRLEEDDRPWAAHLPQTAADQRRNITYAPVVYLECMMNKKFGWTEPYGLENETLGGKDLYEGLRYAIFVPQFLRDWAHSGGGQVPEPPFDLDKAHVVRERFESFKSSMT